VRVGDGSAGSTDQLLLGERIAGWVARVLESEPWAKNLERFDWKPFVRTGRELDEFVASEQERVHGIVTDLGLNE
jgi:tripartite-type tricarboxylate transporter receptor subunit TctC